MKLEPLGDSAVVATLGPGIDPATLASVRGLAAAVAGAKARGIVEVVPAYATVTVFYDLGQFEGSAYEAVCRIVESCSAQAAAVAPAGEAARIDIPVCYGERGPDLAGVAAHCGMGEAEVIALHSGADYLVHAVGFAPGFPYLGGLPDALRTPRRDTPRPRVQAGSVGIGGSQTGVYTIESPGGWQIIGRTPIALFRPGQARATLLRVGDRVRFRAISEGEFESWK